MPSRPAALSAKRGPRARRRTYARKLGLTLFATLSGALAFSILSDGGRQTHRMAPLFPRADLVLSWSGLRIDQVAVSGQRLTSDTDIFDAIDMPSARSLLTFDSAGARERIERLPWIATASVSRVFPGTLDIHVTEREPAALWRRGGHEYLIDATGRVLSAVQPGTHMSLPRVAGEGAATQAQALLDLVMRYPRIRERFKLAERVGERRWTLRLEDGVTVHLGADREAAAFAALSSDEDLGQLLSGRDLAIDLRTRGRVAVRPDPHPAGAPAASAPQSQPRS
jgi:cell division protein FtsQ